MALIKCEECHKEISDTVKHCPHCGYKRTTRKEKEVKEKLKSIKSNKKLMITGIAILVIIIAAIILFISLTGTIRNAKKLTKYLESRGFVCSKETDGSHGYVCENKEDGKNQEFKISTSLSFEKFPSSVYEISWGKNHFNVYSQLYTKGAYHSRGNAIRLFLDGTPHNFVPSRKRIESVVDVQDYAYDNNEKWYVGDQAEEVCDSIHECSSYDDLINETLRFYEKVHKNAGVYLEDQD